MCIRDSNYSEEWAAEARRRGLPCLDHMAAAARAFVDQKNVDMFARTKIFTPDECRSRYEVLLERYVKTTHIEALTMLEMVDRSVLPASIEFMGRIARSSYYAGQEGVSSRATVQLAKRLAAGIDAMERCV